MRYNYEENKRIKARLCIAESIEARLAITRFWRFGSLGRCLLLQVLCLIREFLLTFS
jgi:hypothetical protein